MTGRHQFRSAFGWRSADGAATEVSLDVDGVVCGMVDDVLLSLVAGVVAGVAALGLGVEFMVESAGRVAGLPGRSSIARRPGRRRRRWSRRQLLS
jgi:hypothetical protein